MLYDADGIKQELLTAGNYYITQLRLSPCDISKTALNRYYSLFLLASITYDEDDTFMDVDTDNGVIYANLSFNCDSAKRGLISTVRSALKLYASYKFNASVSLVPEYEGREKVSNVEVLSAPLNKGNSTNARPLNIKKLQISDMNSLTEFETKLTLRYHIYTNESLKLKHRVIKYVLEHYLDYLDSKGEQYDVLGFYKPLSGAAKVIDIERLEKEEKVKELKDKLTKGVNPYILNDWTPNIKEYDIKTILSRIRKHFTEKRVCAICGEEFTPALNKPDQFVCGNSGCVKLKNQKKNILKRYIEKHKPQSKQEIIEYMKGSEALYLKRFPEMKRVEHWDVLVEGLLEELRLENAKN